MRRRRMRIHGVGCCLALTPDNPDGAALVAASRRRTGPRCCRRRCRAGDLSGFKAVETPDLLDMLVTSKNHDLKAAKLPAADVGALAVCPGQSADTGRFSGRWKLGHQPHEWRFRQPAWIWHRTARRSWRKVSPGCFAVAGTAPCDPAGSRVSLARRDWLALACTMGW